MIETTYRWGLLKLAAVICAVLIPSLSPAAPVAGVFDNIDGGQHDLTDWRGQPVLVVNTASLCAFTPQYDGLQTLWDTYKDRGLVVLAVPSDDFRQELSSGDEVRDFCEVNFGLTLPMTDITSVSGPDAHPFYQAVRDETGFVPAWNFNKVLIGPEGEIVDTFAASVRPTSRRLLRQIEPYLSN